MLAQNRTEIALSLLPSTTSYRARHSEAPASETWPLAGVSASPVQRILPIFLRHLAIADFLHVLTAYGAEALVAAQVP